MDHFVLPPGAQHYIAVPYKCVEPYDNGSFHTYPERKGWTADDIEGKDEYGHRRPEEVETFFQSWLFFGVLAEVFRIVDIKINTDDFIDYDKGLVTTGKLPELLEELAMAWKKMWPENLTYEFASTPKAVAMTEILNTVIRVMRPYCYGHIIGAPLSVLPSPLSPEVVVSIIGLTTTFRNASAHMCVESGYHAISPGPGGTPLLHSILRKKWCPFHANTMQTELGLDGQYYIGVLPGLSGIELQRHNDCTDIRCVEKSVDEDTYILKHAVVDCSCQSIPVPEVDLLDVIEKGDTPVVFYRKRDDNSYELEIRGYNTAAASSLSYIAISHVWSDGMGNPKQNALPACLLESIQRMADGVNFPGRESYDRVGFWMDTLCIPVDPKHDGYRKATIIKMRQIYQEASAVLVLESQLQSISSTASMVERCVLLYLTKWIRRLWTYQEAGLSKWLSIQFRDKSLELHEVYAGGGADPLAPERRSENAALETQRALASQFCSNMQSQFGLLHGALFTWAKENKMDEMRWAALLPMVESFSSRMTTRQSDEPLCLASILALDSTPLVKVKAPDGLKSKDKEIRQQADRELADERMAVLYRLIGKFNGSIIFTKFPRLPLEGFRWGPRTYLGELPWFSDQELKRGYEELSESDEGSDDGSEGSDEGSDWETDEGSEGSDERSDWKTDEGSNMDADTKSDPNKGMGIIYTWGIDNTNTGLLVKFPAITFNYPFNFDVNGNQRIFMETHTENPRALGRRRYLIEPVNVHNDPEDFSWIVDTSYYLIMQSPLQKRVVEQSRVAVLGRLLPWDDSMPLVRYKRLIRVTLLLSSQHDETYIPKLEGTELPECSLVIV